MGGEFKPQSSFSSLVPDGSYGSFTFNGSYTGFSYADFLLGIPFQSSRLNPLVGRKRTDSELGIFVQDAFKVSSLKTCSSGRPIACATLDALRSSTSTVYSRISYGTLWLSSIRAALVFFKAAGARARARLRFSLPPDRSCCFEKRDKAGHWPRKRFA